MAYIGVGACKRDQARRSEICCRRSKRRETCAGGGLWRGLWCGVCVWRGAGRGGTMVGRRLYVGETQPCALARVVAEGLWRGAFLQPAAHCWKLKHHWNLQHHY